jgi:hypothetical protein
LGGRFSSSSLRQHQARLGILWSWFSLRPLRLRGEGLCLLPFLSQRQGEHRSKSGSNRLSSTSLSCEVCSTRLVGTHGLRLLLTLASFAQSGLKTASSIAYSYLIAFQPLTLTSVRFASFLVSGRMPSIGPHDSERFSLQSCLGELPSYPSIKLNFGSGLSLTISEAINSRD